jgi:hypothetical protein
VLHPRPHLARYGISLILAVCLAACGGGGVSPREYVRSVCEAMADWQGEIQDRSTSLAQDLGTDATPQQGKDALAEFLDGVITDTEGMVDQVEEAGSPDIQDGEDQANRLTDALTQVLEAFRAARTEVQTLPTDSPEAFQQRADEIGSAIQSAITEAGSTFEQPSPELDPVFEGEPACDQLNA